MFQETHVTIRLCAYRGCVNDATERGPEDGDEHRMRFCKDHWEVYDALVFDVEHGLDGHEDIEQLNTFWIRARGMCDYHGCTHVATLRESGEWDQKWTRFCVDHWQVYDALSFNVSHGFNDSDVQHMEAFWQKAREMTA